MGGRRPWADPDQRRAFALSLLVHAALLLALVLWIDLDLPDREPPERFLVIDLGTPAPAEVEMPAAADDEVAQDAPTPQVAADLPGRPAPGAPAAEETAGEPAADPEPVAETPAPPAPPVQEVAEPEVEETP